MKALTKIQFIDLANAIRCDEISTSNYRFISVIKKGNSQKIFGSDEEVTLKPGIYCVIYTDEYDGSDIPCVNNFIEKRLSEDDFESTFREEKGLILIFCLDLF